LPPTRKTISRFRIWRCQFIGNCLRRFAIQLLHV